MSKLSKNECGLWDGGSRIHKRPLARRRRKEQKRKAKEKELYCENWCVTMRVKATNPWNLKAVLVDEKNLVSTEVNNKFVLNTKHWMSEDCEMREQKNGEGENVV